MCFYNGKYMRCSLSFNVCTRWYTGVLVKTAT